MRCVIEDFRTFGTIIQIANVYILIISLSDKWFIVFLHSMGCKLLLNLLTIAIRFIILSLFSCSLIAWFSVKYDFKFEVHCGLISHVYKVMSL